MSNPPQISWYLFSYYTESNLAFLFLDIDFSHIIQAKQQKHTIDKICLFCSMRLHVHFNLVFFYNEKDKYLQNHLKKYSLMDHVQCDTKVAMLNKRESIFLVKWAARTNVFVLLFFKKWKKGIVNLQMNTGHFHIWHCVYL